MTHTSVSMHHTHTPHASTPPGDASSTATTTVSSSSLASSSTHAHHYHPPHRQSRHVALMSACVSGIVLGFLASMLKEAQQHDVDAVIDASGSDDPGRGAPSNSAADLQEALMKKDPMSLAARRPPHCQRSTVDRVCRDPDAPVTVTIDASGMAFAENHVGMWWWRVPRQADGSLVPEPWKIPAEYKTLVVIGGRLDNPTKELTAHGKVVWRLQDQWFGPQCNPERCVETFGYMNYLADPHPEKPVLPYIMFVHGHDRSWHQQGSALNMVSTDNERCIEESGGYTPLSSLACPTLWQPPSSHVSELVNAAPFFTDYLPHLDKETPIEGYIGATFGLPARVVAMHPPEFYQGLLDNHNRKNDITYNGIFFEFIYHYIFGEPQRIDTQAPRCPHYDLALPPALLRGEHALAPPSTPTVSATRYRVEGNLYGCWVLPTPSRTTSSMDNLHHNRPAGTGSGTSGIREKVVVVPYPQRPTVALPTAWHGNATQKEQRRRRPAAPDYYSYLDGSRGEGGDAGAGTAENTTATVVPVVIVWGLNYPESFSKEALKAFREFQRRGWGNWFRRSSQCSTTSHRPDTCSEVMGYMSYLASKEKIEGKYIVFLTGGDMMGTWRTQDRPPMAWSSAEQIVSAVEAAVGCLEGDPARTFTSITNQQTNSADNNKIRRRYTQHFGAVATNKRGVAPFRPREGSRTLPGVAPKLFSHATFQFAVPFAAAASLDRLYYQLARDLATAHPSIHMENIRSFWHIIFGRPGVDPAPSCGASA